MQYARRGMFSPTCTDKMHARFFSPWLNLIYYDIIQVKKALLERCLEVEKTAKEQATDNAILDQLTKVL